MRRSIVEFESLRSSPDINAQRLPGKRRLENPLSQVTCEKEAVWPFVAQRSKKTQLGDTDVLRLINNCEVERRISTIRELLRKQAEHVGPGHQTSVLKFGLDPFKDGTRASNAALRAGVSCVQVVLYRDRRPSYPTARHQRRSPTRSAGIGG